MKQHNSAFVELCNSARENVKEISIIEVKEMMDLGRLALLIDVREDNEWEKDHLPNAYHLGRGIIERDIELLVPDRSTDMILYCGGGYRSALTAESLQKMGYTNVSSMAGGYRMWVLAQYPLIK